MLHGGRSLQHSLGLHSSPTHVTPLPVNICVFVLHIDELHIGFDLQHSPPIALLHTAPAHTVCGLDIFESSGHPPNEEQVGFGVQHSELVQADLDEHSEFAALDGVPAGQSLCEKKVAQDVGDGEGHTTSEEHFTFVFSQPARHPQIPFPPMHEILS